MKSFMNIPTKCWASREKSHEGQKRHLLRPFHSKDLPKLAILSDDKSPTLTRPQSYAKYRRMPIIINQGGWLILQDLLNERVAEGEACNPHDFNVHAYKCYVYLCPFLYVAVRVSFAEQTSKGILFRSQTYLLLMKKGKNIRGSRKNRKLHISKTFHKL